MKTILSKIKDHQVIFYEKGNESHEFNYPEIQKLEIVYAKIRYLAKPRVLKPNLLQRFLGAKVVQVQEEKEFLLSTVSELRVVIHSNQKAAFYFNDEKLASELKDYDPRSIKKRHLHVNGLHNKIITHVANISEIKFISS